MLIEKIFGQIDEMAITLPVHVQLRLHCYPHSAAIDKVYEYTI